jgi:hypothetical protein
LGWVARLLAGWLSGRLSVCLAGPSCSVFDQLSLSLFRPVWLVPSSAAAAARRIQPYLPTASCCFIFFPNPIPADPGLKGLEGRGTLRVKVCGVGAGPPTQASPSRPFFPFSTATSPPFSSLQKEAEIIRREYCIRTQNPERDEHFKPFQSKQHAGRDQQSTRRGDQSRAFSKLACRALSILTCSIVLNVNRPLALRPTSRPQAATKQT